MIDEFTKSLKANLYDRVVSPLFGAFVLSWLVWNYRLVVVLLATGTFEHKFAYIDTVLYKGDSIYDLWTLLVYPLGSALLFLFLYPFPAQWVYSFWRQQQKKLKMIRQKIEDETPLTIEEARKLKKGFSNISQDYENVILVHEREIDRLKKIIEEERGIKDALRAELEKKPDMPPAPTASDDFGQHKIEKLLLNYSFQLTAPAASGVASRRIEFVRGGKIFRGNSNSFNKWRIHDGKLEILNSENVVIGRYDYIPEKRIFLSTDDVDLRTPKGSWLEINPRGH